MLVTYGILPHPVARPDRDHHGEIADTVRLARAANRADQSLQRFGFVTFFAPISVLLFVPTLAGIAAAIALHNEARLPLPNPPRARVARAAWLLTWTTLACGAANLGQLSVARLPAQPAALLLVGGDDGGSHDPRAVDRRRGDQRAGVVTLRSPSATRHVSHRDRHATASGWGGH